MPVKAKNGGITVTEATEDDLESLHESLGILLVFVLLGRFYVGTMV